MKLTKTIFAVLIGVSLGLGWTAFAVTNQSLTRNGYLQYLNYIRDSFLIGGTATTSDARLSVVGSTTVSGTGIFGGELRVPNIVATSSDQSIFNTGTGYFATTTVVHINGGSGTGLVVNGSTGIASALKITNTNSSTCGAGTASYSLISVSNNALVITSPKCSNSRLDLQSADGIAMLRGWPSGSVSVGYNGSDPGAGSLGVLSKLHVGSSTVSAISKIHSYESSTEVGSGGGITVQQDSTGDALTQYLLTGVRRWVQGIDNSDNDSFGWSPVADLANKVMTLTVGGNLGIGTTTPMSDLSVDGNLSVKTSAGGVTIKNTGGSSVLFDTFPTTGTMQFNANDLVFQINGTERARLANNTYFGIGTSTPSELLHVYGNIKANGALISARNNALYLQGGDDAAFYDINVANTTQIQGLQEGTVGSLKLGSNGGILSGYSSNIGVGTTTPINKLDVNGSFAVRGAINQSGGGGLFSGYTLAGGGKISAVNPAVTGLPLELSGYPLKFTESHNGTEIARFSSSTNNLGIGTTSPFAKLSIHARNGETNSTLFAVGSSTISATTTHFTVTNDGVTHVGAPFTSENGSLRVNGAIFSSSGFSIPGLTTLGLSNLYAAGNFDIRGWNGSVQTPLMVFQNQGTANLSVNFPTNVSMGTGTNPTSRLKVVGRLSAQPQFDCPVLINTVTAVTADQLGSATLAPTLCNGNMGWDMLGTTDGRIPEVTAALDNFVASGTPPMQLIDVAYTAPNNGGTTTAEGGVAISQALLGSATSSGGIAMEMFLATPTMTNALATTSFVAFAGFTSNTFVSTTSMKAWYGHKDSCMMIATSTPNWRLTCRKAGAYYGVDTGIATTSTPFKILLTLNQGGFSAYFNNSNTAAANIPLANVPAAHLRAAIGAGTLSECSSISGGAAQLASACGISTAKGTNALNVGQLTIWSSDW